MRPELSPKQKSNEMSTFVTFSVLGIADPPALKCIEGPVHTCWHASTLAKLRIVWVGGMGVVLLDIAPCGGALYHPLSGRNYLVDTGMEVSVVLVPSQLTATGKKKNVSFRR